MPSQEETAAQQNLASVKYAHRNDITNVVPDLKASLPSMKKGGVVQKTGPVLLHRGETVVPNPADQQDPQQAAPDQDGQNDSNMSDDSAVQGAPIKIHAAYSRMQEALTKLADGLGLRRSATIPYVHGSQQHEHLQSVSQALEPAGGISKNLITSYHTSKGRGYHSGDGGTYAWPADKARQTIIPKNSEDAKKAISLTRSFVNKIGLLIGDDQSVVAAKSFLDLIGRQDANGMTLADFHVALNQIVHPPLQALSRAYNSTHHEGPSAHLRAPHTQVEQE